MVVEFNIGLNVGSVEPKNQKEFTLETIQKYFGKHDILFSLDNGGKWNNVKERTLVFKVELSSGINSQDINASLSLMADFLKQDAIACYYPELDKGSLNYGFRYKGVERHEFDMKYFIRF